MRFDFIRAEKARHSVDRMCRLLGVTRAGFYAYVARREELRRRPAPKASRCRAEGERLSNEALNKLVARLFEQSRGTYGSPRIHAELKRQGFGVARKRVERAMTGQGLVARSGGVRRRRTTVADPTHAHAPNTLNRQFEAQRPNERWVTDLSYVWTAEGWCYLAVILDLFSRTVVGWSLDVDLTTGLTLRALEMAVRRRGPAEGLLHHSDRGCQYTSFEYQSALARHGIEVSMSRKGNRATAGTMPSPRASSPPLRTSSYTAGPGPTGASCGAACSTISSRSTIAVGSIPR